jgi:hypothetical protein
VESTETVRSEDVIGVRRRQDGGEDHLPGAVNSPSDQPLVSGLE